MKNEDLQEMRKEYIQDITLEVSKMIAKSSKLSLEEAKKAFINSRTYNFLAYSDDPFVEEGPEDFYEMFKNGRMVTDIQIYLEKHPELYINPNEKDNVRKGNNK